MQRNPRSSTSTWLLAPLVAAFSAGPAAAAVPGPDVGEDWSLEFSAQYRPRLILDSERFDLQEDDVVEREFVTHRARLGVAAKHEDGIILSVLFQDVRIWGEELDTLNDFSADGFDVHEAYVVFPIPLGTSELALKIGRQEIILDNARLVGNVGWTQRARAFDGARLTWKTDPVLADFFFTVTAESDQDPDGNVPAGREASSFFGGAHAVIGKSPSVALAWYVLHDDPQDETRHTLGTRATGELGDLTGEGEFYYQLGEIGDESISAYLAALRVGYVFSAPLKPALLLWGEYLSGEGTPDTAFDTLFATNHAFYGEMDYFLVFPRDTAGLGLIDTGGRVAIKPTERLTLHADYHLFRTANGKLAGDEGLGQELDLKATWKAHENVGVRALYGLFFPQEPFGVIRGLPPGTDLATEHFAYLTLDVIF